MRDPAAMQPGMEAMQMLEQSRLSLEGDSPPDVHPWNLHVAGDCADASTL